MAARWFYNLGYRFVRMPWEVGVRDELVELVRTGRLRPGRAIDLGCGTGANAIYLARNGFEVTGIDFAPAGLDKARAAARQAGVEVRFLEDDLTRLRHDLGTFDLLLDYGVLDDLSDEHRNAYVREVTPLAHQGSQFLLWCFEWPPRRLDRLLGFQPMSPGEVTQRFGTHFDIERVAGTESPNLRRFLPGYAAYLMTRKSA